MSRVIVGVGDSAHGLHAMVWAIAEARRRGAELHAVRTWRDRASASSTVFGFYRPMLQAAAACQLHDAFDGAAGGLPAGIHVALVVEEGSAAQVLASYASRDGDLLVVGQSRRRWRVLPGGTVSGCLRNAQCPVVVVPASQLAKPIKRLMRGLHRDISELESVS